MMRFNYEKSHKKDLDMVDPEGVGRAKREFDWDDLANIPFKGEGSDNAGEEESPKEVSEILSQMDAVGSFGKSAREAKLQAGLAEAQENNDEDAIEGYQAAIQMETGLRTIASGEKSTLSETINAEGKSGRRLDSEYFDIVHKFNQEHDRKTIDFKTQLAVNGLATDLALIDATQGKDLERMSTEKKASFLEDYSLLNSRLNDPNTSLEERQFISEYFETMDGTALQRMAQEYDALKQEGATENDDATEKAKSIITEAEENLESTKRIFADCSADFDKALANMDEMIDERSMDIDDLESAFSKLKRFHEELSQWIAIYEAENREYEGALYSNKNSIDENEYNARMRSTYENEDEISAAKSKVIRADDEIARIKIHISKIEDILYQINSF